MESALNQLPTVLTIGPYRIAFWSQDCAEPAHMHVFRDSYSAKFWLETGALAINHGFRRKELLQIARLVEANQSLLQEKWNEHFAELELIKLKLRQAQPVEAMVDEETLTVELNDGRTISVPLVWFPRLRYGTPHERSHIEYFADTLYWPLLDEHIGIETLLLGPSLIPESGRSLAQWKAELTQRRALEAA